VGEMSLHVVTKGPSFIVQAYRVGSSIQTLYLSKNTSLKVPDFPPQVGSPASQELTQTRRDVLPSVNRVEATSPGCLQLPPLVSNQADKIRPLQLALFKEEAATALLPLFPRAQD
jgi:hypothetical protein